MRHSFLPPSKNIRVIRFPLHWQFIIEMPQVTHPSYLCKPFQAVFNDRYLLDVVLLLS